MGDGLDNVMSSWDCGKNVSYNFCRDHEIAGIALDCSGKKGESGAGRAQNTAVGRNDRMSTLKLQRYNYSE